MLECPYLIRVALFALGTVFADPLYRWVDAEGNVHYSDHKPRDAAQVLHPDTGHEPTPEERDASKVKKLEKEIEKLKQEMGKTKEAPQQPVVVIPVPIVQPQPKLYTPYWGPIYPYRSQQFHPGSSAPRHVHPRRDAQPSRTRQPHPPVQKNPRRSPENKQLPSLIGNRLGLASINSAAKPF